MRYSPLFMLIFAASILAATATHAKEQAASKAAGKGAADGFVDLFNGKDLKGWKGDERVWSVQDGVLVGQSPKGEPLTSNTFAIWEGEVGDFELIAEFRLTGDNNSGVQYRSKANPKVGPYSIVGYQADIHAAPEFTGMLYDEGGRGIAAQRGQQVTLKPESKNEVKPLPGKFDPIDVSKWSTIEVKAVGNRLTHKINGEVTVDVTDDDPKNAEAKGLLALQVHAGPKMKAEYKLIRLKRLDKETVK